MRKRVFVLLILAALFFASASVCASAEVFSALELPAGLKTIREQAYYQDSGLSEAVLPEGMKRVEAEAFAQSGLRYIHLPESLEYIAENAFSGCVGLKAACPEGSYAYDYCKKAGIEIVQKPLVVRLLPSVDTRDDGSEIADKLCAELTRGVAELEQSVRLQCYPAEGSQAGQAADAIRRGADLIIIDAADAETAGAIMQSGIPALFYNTDPEIVTADDDLLFVGCAEGKNALADTLASACGTIAANRLLKGSWVEGLDYEITFGKNVYLEPAPRLAGVRIGIDPGHQRHANTGKEYISPTSSTKKAKVSSGTKGVKTKVPEYKRVLEISLLLRDSLEELGATVYMTRETHDVNISNKERALMMNELGVDLVLRIHCDGATAQSAHGISLYVNKTGPIASESAKAAKKIIARMIKATGAYERGVKKSDSYTGLNWSTVPCILVECGFMTNPEEDKLLATTKYQKKLVKGMVEGICDYMGV